MIDFSLVPVVLRRPEPRGITSPVRTASTIPPFKDTHCKSSSPQVLKVDPYTKTSLQVVFLIMGVTFIVTSAQQNNKLLILDIKISIWLNWNLWLN